MDENIKAEIRDNISDVNAEGCTVAFGDEVLVIQRTRSCPRLFSNCELLGRNSTPGFPIVF